MEFETFAEHLRILKPKGSDFFFAVVQAGLVQLLHAQCTMVGLVYVFLHIVCYLVGDGRREHDTMQV